ncbi:3-dehydroquinate synthase, partial [Fulvivirga sp. RKSG066]|uniref:3-dehydroquinate synthase n=1 Tax=Fulvivirga aurantia TaxID=2529383 RepID=UPI0012BC8EA9
HCLPLLNNVLKEAKIIAIKSGEKNKTLDTCSDIWEKMTEYGLDRKSLMINLGGGVIGDMGGFGASTYKRGIDFINIPTTLLSQVDASVGGKLGIDFKGFKNHIGLFKDPKMVLVDSKFLNTLPKRELRSGFAEIIKHSIIADKNQWNKIKVHAFDELDFEKLIQQSVAIKVKVVEEDPEEAGLRKILNFGHTIGHAIESFYLETPSQLLHGEAIAIGMICEAYVAEQKNMLTSVELKEITDYIFGIYGKTDLPKEDFDPIINLMSQ